MEGLETQRRSPRDGARRIFPAFFLRRRVDERPRLRRALANTAWLLGDRLLRLGLGLAVGVWLARHLGPDRYGVYSYVLAFVALLGPLATMGLDAVVVRDLVRDPTARDEILGSASMLKLGGSLILVASATLLMPLLRPSEPLLTKLAFIAATATVFQAVDTIDLWFQSQVSSKYSVLARNAALLASASLRVGLILWDAPLVAFVLAGALELAIGAFGLWVAYRYTGLFVTSWRVSLSRAGHLLQSSWPLMLSGLAVLVYMRIDQLMLGNLVGDNELGVYSAAVKLSEIWYFVPLAITTSVYPTVIATRDRSPQLYYERLQSLFSLMALLGYAVALPLSMLAGPLVRWLYGIEFADAGPVLAILLWAGFFVCLGVAREVWTVAEGMTEFSLATTVLGALVNILLNLFYVPMYGGKAAAVATLLAQIVAVSLSTALYKKTRPIFWMQCRALLFFGGVRL